MTGMTKPNQKVFAVLRDLVPSNKPLLFDVVDRLERDSRMDAVWPSNIEAPLDQIELLRMILAAADKAAFGPKLESAKKAWHAEKDRCVRAVQTLTELVSIFPSAPLSKTQPGDTTSILSEFRQMEKPRPSRCGRPTDPSPFDEINQLKKSLAFAEEMIGLHFAALEQAVRADLPASRNRGMRETQFCVSLCSLLTEHFGQPMHRFVTITTNVVLELHNRPQHDEDIEMTEKEVAEAWRRERLARAKASN